MLSDSGDWNSLFLWFVFKGRGFGCVEWNWLLKFFNVRFGVGIWNVRLGKVRDDYWRISLFFIEGNIWKISGEKMWEFFI